MRLLTYDAAKQVGLDPDAIRAECDVADEATVPECCRQAQIRAVLDWADKLPELELAPEEDADDFFGVLDSHGNWRIQGTDVGEPLAKGEVAIVVVRPGQWDGVHNNLFITRV